jgi:acyl-CoA-dependent ceramide synthase
LAKCLKYCGFTTICDVLFGFFLLTWFVARHVLHILVVWSLYSDARNYISPSCFSGNTQNLTGPFEAPTGFSHYVEPFYKPDGIVCFNEPVRWSFIIPLVGLQMLMVVWFTMAIRVAVKVVCGGSAEDVRSDAEDEDENETDEFIYEEAQPLEEEVGVEEINLKKSWERRSSSRRQGSSSAVSIHDRKELLGRIGCEKQVD